MHSEPPQTEAFQSGSSLALTAGQMIRAARLQRGLHLAVLAVNLKVSMRQLEALESDQYDTSKGPVFVRALASSVCRHLHIDPIPVLALLPPAPDRLPSQRQSLQAMTTLKKIRPENMAFLTGLSLQTVVVAGVMVTLIASLIWMPSPASWNLFKSDLKADVPTAPMVEPVPEAISTTNELSPAASEPSSASVSMHAPLQTSSPVPNLPTQEMPLVSSSSIGQFVFNARQESWIEIRDRKNQVLWSRVLQAGQAAEVQFALPMNVVVGRAREVDVTYKGKPFDLAPHTKVTVARFEVKE